MRISVPRSDEYAAAFERYVGRVRAVDDPVRELEAQRDRLRARLSPLTDEQGQFRYAPGKWSIKDLVNHLCDAERVFAYRLLRIGRGDQTPLPGFEENDYAAEADADRRPMTTLLSEWTAVRNATVALAQSLREADWSRQGMSNDAPATPRALLYIILGHTEHHMAVLSDRYGIR